jgi:hypothetical protein
MDEVTFRSGFLGTYSEHADAISNAAAADAINGQANLDSFRIGKGAGVSAARLDNDKDQVSRRDIKQATLDQPGVHRGVEPLIINRVVDVPVGIIVSPARADFPPDVICSATPERSTSHAAIS